MSHDSTHRGFGLSATKEAPAQQDSVSSFRCSHCVLIFKTRVYLYEHLHQVHGLSVEEALRDSGLKSLPQIKPKAENRLKTIKSDFAFNCKHCSFKSVNWSIFNEHKKQCTGSSKNESPRPKARTSLKEQKTPTGSKDINHVKGTHNSSPVDVKIYSNSSQTITKYFPSAATIKSNCQPKEKTKTLRLEGSSLNSCGVFQVNAKSIDMRQVNTNDSHLLSDLISDPTSAKPVDPFQEAVLKTDLKRTTKEQAQCPSKRAKLEMDQPNQSQTSTCAELSFEFSDDEEKNDLDIKADIIKCKHCDFQSASIEHVYSHYEVNHPYLRYNSFYIEEKSDQSVTFRCLECPVEFSSDLHLRDHYSKDHPDAPNIFSRKSAEMKLVYKCFMCPFTSNILQGLKGHHKEKHPSHKVENPLLYCKYTLPQHSISLSERRFSEEHESPEIRHLQETTTTCQDQRSPTVSPNPQMKAQDGTLYNCVKCSFSHKSVVVLHVHYKKSHPDEPISLDKIKQSVGAPSVTALAQQEVDLSPSFVKEKWASPLSDPENTVTRSLQPALLSAELDHPLSSSENEKTYFCEVCDFSSLNVKSVLNHHNAKHGFNISMEDVLQYNSTIKSKKSPVAGGYPSPMELYYCHVCNSGHSAVTGLLKHQKKAHNIALSKERVLEHSARIHDQIEKAKSHPNNSILPCGLPLPIIKGYSKVYFCYFCNFRNKEMGTINRHFSRVHNVGHANPQKIREHTSIIFERLNARFQRKSLEENQKFKAKQNMTKPRTSKLLRESLPARLKCFECLYEAHHIYLMRKHVINCHNTVMSFPHIVQTCGIGPHFEPGFYCDICPFRCESVEEVKSHGKETHSRGLSIKTLNAQTYLSPGKCDPKKKSHSFENDDGRNGNSPQAFPDAYSCKSCSFKGTSFSSITSHYQTAHPMNAKQDKRKKKNLSCNKKKFKDSQQDFDSYQEPLDFDKVDVPSSKPKEYSCPHCPATFEDQGGVIIHIGMKHRDKADKQPQLAKRMQVYKCRSCSYVNNIRHGVFIHTKMKHPTKGMKSDTLIVDRQQLQDVEMKVINGFWKFCGFICKACSQIYPSKEKLKEHYRTHKKRPELNAAMSSPKGSKVIQEEIWCQFCGLFCASARELNSHLSVCQKNSSVYPCVLCLNAFPTKVRLGIHYTKKHGKKAFFKHYAPLYNQPSNKTVVQNNSHEQVNTEQLSMFKCPSCRYVNSSYHGTLTHLQMRHPKIVARAERLKTVEIDTANVIGYLPNCKTYGGFRCKKCPLIYRELKKLNKHCEMEHNSKSRASSQPPAHAPQPPAAPTTEVESAASQTKVVTKFRHFFKCFLCSYSTPILKTLGRHYRNKHGKHSYTKYYSPLFRQIHPKPTSSVTNEQPKPLEQSENTQQKVTPQVRVYKCGICSYGTPYRRYLVAHFKNRHKLETNAINKQMEKFKNWKSTLPMGQFSCKKCPHASFQSKGRLLSHYDLIHSSKVKEFKIVAERTDRTTGVFKCLHCKQKIYGIKNICKHLDAHRDRLLKKHLKMQSKIAEVSEEKPPTLSPIKEEIKLEIKTEDPVVSSPVPPLSVMDAVVPRQPSEGRNTCQRCKRSFMSLKGLRSHQRSHLAFAALDNFTSSDSLEQFDQYMAYRPGTTRPYMCKLCPYRSSVMALCKTHFLKKHRNFLPSAVPDFQEETRQMTAIAPNVMNDLNVDGDEGPESSFLEPPDVQRQLKHYTVMAQVNPTSKVQDIQLSDPRMLPCEMCNFNSQHYGTMRRHYLRRHGKKLIRCKDCSFFTCFRQNLELHEQMGHSCVQSEPTHLKNLCCPFCLYQSKNKNNMIDHIVLHRDERMMPIEVRRSKLSRYLQGVVFRCYKCTFTSGSADGLDSHMAKHNDIKPFKCRLCYFDCTQLSDLEAHLCDKHQVIRNHQLVGQVSLDQFEERENCNSQDDDDYNDDDDNVLHNPQSDEALENEQVYGEMAKDAAHPIKENENYGQVLADKICQDTHNTQSTNGQSCEEKIEDPADVNEIQLHENTHDQAQTKADEEMSESSVRSKAEDHCEVQDNSQSVMADVENQKENSEKEHVEGPKVNCAVAVDSLKDSESNSDTEKAFVDDTTDTGENGLIPPVLVDLQISHVEGKQDITGVDAKPNDKTDEGSYGEMPILEKYFKEQSFIFAQRCENSEKTCTEEEGEEDGSEGGKMDNQGAKSPPILIATDCPAVVNSPVAATMFPCDLCGRCLANTSELQRHMMRHGM